MNKNTLIKIFQSIILSSGSLWLGAQVSKLLLIFYFFNTDQFGRITLKPEVPKDTINIIVYQLTPVFSISLVSYLIFIGALIIYLFLELKKLKLKGWLFISLLIVILLIPFEIYLSTIDLDIAIKSFYRIGDSKLFLTLLEERITKLGNIPFISVFLHLICFILIVFKPLNKEAKVEN